MKILFCTNAFEVVSNGPAKFAHLLLKINELYPEHEIRILTEDTTHADEKIIYKQTLRIPSVFRKLGMFFRMYQYHKRAMMIKRNGFNFDHIIYNNAIVGIWSSVRFKNTIGFVNDDTNASIKWKHNFFRLKWSKELLFYFVEKLACHTCCKVVVNSKYLFEKIKKEYKIRESKLFCLYKSIDPVVPFVKPHNEIPLILFVKNDYKRGGLFTLIDALKNLTQPIRIIIAGTIPSDVKKIENYLQGCNFLYEIKGILKQKEIFELMTRADIFCVPSLLEALGVANIEAMAHGCSIISTKTGGIPEVLDNGNCGWLVDAGNATQLTIAIEECLTNETLRNEKRNNAFQMIKNFERDSMLHNFLNVLSKNELA